MISIDSTTVTYDAFGRMVEKNVGGAYTQIVYGPLGTKFAVMSGQTLVQGFIPLPTGAKAVYTPSGLAYYRHHDHLGSSRLATTPSRTMYSSTAYAPFGEPYRRRARRTCPSRARIRIRFQEFMTSWIATTFQCRGAGSPPIRLVLRRWI